LHQARTLLKPFCLRLVKRHFEAHGKAVIASLLVGLVLLLGAMAASPSLHERLHADASEAGHHCAVTLFAHGQVDSASADINVDVPKGIVVSDPLVQISAYSPAIENLPAGRAPPVSASNS
jgi:hypothetical protein